MEHKHKHARRAVIKSSLLGITAVAIPNIVFAKNIMGINPDETESNKLFHRYPSIDDEIVSEVVGASHFDLERVKELVINRPELARATWDWGFGDWESAIGAAAHVGRRDIVDFLIKNGARPNIFTYAMLGHYEAVKQMIESIPGIQSLSGPHGISLTEHSRAGLRMKDKMDSQQVSNSKKLIAYLETLQDADGKSYEKMDDEDKDKYLGDYKYGDGENEGFSIKLNMRKMISLGKIGAFGGALYKIGNNRFTYNGTPSVEITFQLKDDNVISLTVHEPDLTLKAIKVLDQR